MNYPLATFRCLLLLLLFNCVALWKLPVPNPIKIFILLILIVHFFAFIIAPKKRRPGINTTEKLGRLDNAACILGYGRALLWLELLPIMILAVIGNVGIARMIINALAAYLFIFIINLTGIVRVALSSRQVKPILWVLLVFTWYIPVVNSLVLRSFGKTARTEYRVEQAKHELDGLRVESRICETKYPILMVHGIFFRDWQYFNYWGRIPAELIKNGATIYYGNQQSANTVAQSASEIAAQIESIIAETGAEKVNIIAHSKGGLDSRYAISKLGMSRYVASLTTINTPHRGCEWVDHVLEKAPEGLKKFVDNKYNRLFTRLGDNSPHFMLGVQELTAASCERFNSEVPDAVGVRYNSVMSRMRTPRSAGFPLNLGYYLNKPYTKLGSDGLVPVESGLYFPMHSMIPDTKKRGISHGDMIDLFRENIDDFDVREYFVKIAAELKERGF